VETDRHHDPGMELYDKRAPAPAQRSESESRRTLRVDELPQLCSSIATVQSEPRRRSNIQVSRESSVWTSSET